MRQSAHVEQLLVFGIAQWGNRRKDRFRCDAMGEVNKMFVEQHRERAFAAAAVVRGDQLLEHIGVVADAQNAQDG